MDIDLDITPPDFIPSSSSRSHRHQTMNEANITASAMSLDRIKRYFGKVKYKFIRDELLFDDYETIATKILKYMTEYDLEMSVSSFQDFQDCLAKDVPQVVKKNSQDLIDFYSTLLEEVFMKTKDNKTYFFEQLQSSLPAVCESFKNKENNCMMSYLSLINLCEYEVNRYKDKCSHSGNRAHTLWRTFWRTLLSPNMIPFIEDGGLHQIYIQQSGECEPVIEIIPTSLSRPDDDDDESACTGKTAKPIEITTMPDFAMFKSNLTTMIMDKQYLIVGEVKTSYDDSRQTDSNTKSFKNMFERQNQVILEENTAITVKGEPVCHAEQPEGNEGLESMKTQHFLELLSLLREGMMDAKQKANKKIFGLYLMMNNAYITCLIPRTHDVLKTSLFTCATESTRFHDANSSIRPCYFEMICLPPLNIFVPGHLKVLLSFINFIVWSESKNMTGR